MINKATSYLASDPNTPLVSEYCSYMFRLFAGCTASLHEDSDRALLWRLRGGAWPYSNTWDDKVMLIAAAELDTDAKDLQSIRELLHTATKDTDISGLIPNRVAVKLQNYYLNDTLEMKGNARAT
eukprot:GHVQ01030862.1.p1 GENE.GHVQ01030862.1~~GHVQ01030862.1.p1  ORF type:complete len:125 (+),score=8.58 GHVQ01030862.1:112-486(+)